MRRAPVSTVALLASVGLAAAQAPYSPVVPPTVPQTGAQPPATPAGQQQLISGTSWINGRQLVGGKNWRDNYQIIHDILNGMGTWDANGVYRPTIPMPYVTATPYTTQMLLTSQDGFSVNVGGLPDSDTLGKYSGTTNALSGKLVIPAGPYAGVDTNPDAAIAAYVINRSVSLPGQPGKSGVALYTNAMSGANGAFVEGANITAVNTDTPFSSNAASAGYDFPHMTGLELDLNVYCNGVYSIPTDTCGHNPTGDVYGFKAQLHGTGRGTAGETAFIATGTTGSQYDTWDTAFASIGGAAAHGLLLGPNAFGTASLNSQDIRFQAVNAAGAPAPVTTIFDDANGVLQFIVQGKAMSFSAGGITAPGFNLPNATPGPNANSASLTFGAFDSTNAVRTGTAIMDSTGVGHLIFQATDVAFGSFGVKTSGLSLLPNFLVHGQAGAARGPLCSDVNGTVYVENTKATCS